MKTYKAAILCVVLAGVSMSINCVKAAPEPAIQARDLTNGIRAVSIHFPSRDSVSIFSFLPMGLTSDAPDQAQWSHLIEHLVIRSTMPAGSAQANAETLPDHMRLDYYGNKNNWKEGLSHHRRWLKGEPFTEINLEAEKPKVLAECEFTARNLATHKFAVAAWSHGLRHGKKHVALKEDVRGAPLDELQALRDKRLTVSNHVTVCVVGGVKPEDAFEEIEDHFGELRLEGESLSAGKAAPIAGNLELTWDLEARHLLIVWPIPDFQSEDHAALVVAAQRLNMLWNADPELSRQAGMIFAGADLTTPEGSFFFVSASLRPAGDFETLRNALFEQLEALAKIKDPFGQTSFMARQLAGSYTRFPYLETLKKKAPQGIDPAMIEANAGLRLGMYEHRYGAFRSELAERIGNVTAAKVKAAADRWLTREKAGVCYVRPAQTQTEEDGQGKKPFQ